MDQAKGGGVVQHPNWVFLRTPPLPPPLSLLAFQDRGGEKLSFASYQYISQRSTDTWLLASEPQHFCKPRAGRRFSAGSCLNVIFIYSSRAMGGGEQKGGAQCNLLGAYSSAQVKHLLQACNSLHLEGRGGTLGSDLGTGIMSPPSNNTNPKGVGKGWWQRLLLPVWSV